MSSTSQSYSLSYKNINLAITVSSCSALEDKKSLKLNSASSISMPGADNDYPPGCIVRLLSMTFRPHNGSFTGQYSSNGDTDYSYYLASDIQTNVMILNNNSVHTVNINLAFTCGNRSCDSTAVCVYWDFSLNAWSSSGCLTQVTHGITNCICNHLTSFSVLMSGFVPENTVDSTILDDITEAGLAISIASLLICISIHVILLTQSIKTAAVYRYVTNLNMSVFLLVSNVSFLSSSFIDPNAQEKLCVAFTFLTHFSLLAFFCWTWVQGLYLVCRLVFVFHHVTKTEFLALSIVLGYLCPLVIAVGTFLVYFPNNYMNDNACWLESRSGASMSFNIPTIIIMCGNVLVLVIVIRKLLRPSISEGHNEDEEVIKKLAKALLFCIPQFGLTWAIGIPLFANPNSMALHYMFAILNPLQGLFLLLFGCLLDKKVMDVIKKRVMKTPSPSSMATTLSSA
ncbi:adhesion G-protein coupled receptor F3-like [Pseudophryne corroboree]|uniref:adhesion G-protein coupled receptor F3-like n=1 Tax=Pseudophryne corroboree TaxID=495146 RepID=UPI0030820486